MDCGGLLVTLILVAPLLQLAAIRVSDINLTIEVRFEVYNTRLLSVDCLGKYCVADHTTLLIFLHKRFQNH